MYVCTVPYSYKRNLLKILLLVVPPTFYKISYESVWINNDTHQIDKSDNALPKLSTCDISAL